VYTVREVQANQKRLKLNETVHILFCANDANLLGKIKHTFCHGKGRGAFLFASKEFSLVANADVKQGKFTSDRWENECSECLSIWEQP
jgi:hypothetical protein